MAAGRGTQEDREAQREVSSIEMEADGKGMKPIIVAKYRRAVAGKVSEEDQPELDRVTARS